MWKPSDQPETPWTSGSATATPPDAHPTTPYSGVLVDRTDEIEPLTTSEIRVHADANLRRHLGGALLRISVLLAADGGALLLLRYVARALRQANLLSGAHTGLVDLLFPPGAVPTTQLAIALLLGLVATGCYGRGDNRRDPDRLYMASLLAASRQFWFPLWAPGWPVIVAHAAVLTIALGTTLLVDRIVVDEIVKWYRRRRPSRTRALLIGTPEQCERTRARHGERGDGAFAICGALDVAHPPAPGMLGSLRSLDRHVRVGGVDTIVVCGDVSAFVFGRIARAAIAGECQMLRVYDAPEYVGLEPAVVWQEGQPYILYRRPGLRGTQLLLKRLLDVFGAAALLIALSPVMAVVAVLIRVTSAGPAVFAQRRLGRCGHVFNCLKFRSMYRDAEERLRADPVLYDEYLLNDFKLDPAVDTRITPVGRVLRKLSLDELPQLLNVLRGEMSLVGPRPIVPDEIRHYDDEELLFLSVKPGMTGAWQVSGRSELYYPERATVELEYVSNWSIGTDLSILARTVPAVLRQKGAH